MNTEERYVNLKKFSDFFKFCLTSGKICVKSLIIFFLIGGIYLQDNRGDNIILSKISVQSLNEFRNKCTSF